MAYATEVRTGNNGFIMDRLHAIKASFAKAREQRKAYNQVYEELMSLSRRELDDLGISSSEIPYIAREAANMVK